MALWQTRKSTLFEKTAVAGSAECHSRLSFTTRGDSSADSVGLEEAEHRTTQKELSEQDSQRERESETIPILSFLKDESGIILTPCSQRTEHHFCISLAL